MALGRGRLGLKTDVRIVNIEDDTGTSGCRVILVDASPLIVLAKIQQLALLRATYGSIGVGPLVTREVVDGGRVVDTGGVRQVEAGLEAGWIQTLVPSEEEKRLTQQLLPNTRLGGGEAESIVLGQSQQLTVVLDDKEARATATAMGVRYVGTAGVLLAAFRGQHLSYEELEEVILDLTTALWLSPDVVTEILRRARD